VRATSHARVGDRDEVSELTRETRRVVIDQS